MDPEPDAYGVSSKIKNKENTLSVVFCIYRAMNHPERPNFGNNFSPSNPSGECLLNILDKLFQTSPEFFSSKGQDPLNHF